MKIKQKIEYEINVVPFKELNDFYWTDSEELDNMCYLNFWEWRATSFGFVLVFDYLENTKEELNQRYALVTNVLDFDFDFDKFIEENYYCKNGELYQKGEKND